MHIYQIYYLAIMAMEKKRKNLEIMRDILVLDIGYWKHLFIFLNVSKYGKLTWFIFCFILLLSMCKS